MPTERSGARAGAQARPGDPSTTCETTVIPVPGDGPYAVAVAADGALWVSLARSGNLARVKDGEPARLHPAGGASARPTVVAPGPGARTMWVTQFLGDAITGVGTVDGRTVRVPLDRGAGPFGIATGPDGALWFTELNADRVGRLPHPEVVLEGRPAVVEEFPLPVRAAGAAGITAGADGAMWFALSQADMIGRIGADGSVRLHRLPTPGARPVDITAEPDGTLWFTENGAGRIGRMTGDGQVDEVALPGGAATRPHGITAAADGGCWFTAWGTRRVGRVTPAGRVRMYELPPGVSEPHGIVAAAAGSVWTATESGELVRLTPR
ncbi:virginiamycin B lyase [Streptomyces marokkonensis]|uniref:Virginiamycin B lyase n=1 Tax=Streptomyces marokkonensis TaxID=324855 RepID=A0ABP7NRE0_9ACTN